MKMTCLGDLRRETTAPPVSLKMKSPERGDPLARRKEASPARARGSLERTKNDRKESRALRTPRVTLIRVIVQ